MPPRLRKAAEARHVSGVSLNGRPKEVIVRNCEVEACGGDSKMLKM